MNIIVFSIVISLFLLHEMDAIRTREWRMFVFLKNLKDEISYLIFSIAHFPLYFLIIFCMLQINNQDSRAIFYIVTDILLILHLLVHLLFEKKKIMVLYLSIQKFLSTLLV